MMRTSLTAALILGAMLTAGGAPQDAISKIDRNMEVKTPRPAVSNGTIRRMPRSA